jgi:hypothetical protein
MAGVVVGGGVKTAVSSLISLVIGGGGGSAKIDEVKANKTTPVKITKKVSRAYDVSWCGRRRRVWARGLIRGFLITFTG